MKKNTGITRKIDELGRIVIPIGIRTKLNLKEKDEMEIFIEKGKIILKRYELNCVFCGEKTNLKEYKGQCICKKCMSKINDLN